MMKMMMMTITTLSIIHFNYAMCPALHFYTLYKLSLIFPRTTKICIMLQLRDEISNLQLKRDCIFDSKQAWGSGGVALLKETRSALCKG